MLSQHRGQILEVRVLEVTTSWGWPWGHLGGKAVNQVSDSQSAAGWPSAAPWSHTVEKPGACAFMKEDWNSYLFRIRIYSFLHPLTNRTPIEKSSRKLHSHWEKKVKAKEKCKEKQGSNVGQIKADFSQSKWCCTSLIALWTKVKGGGLI